MPVQISLVHEISTDLTQLIINSAFCNVDKHQYLGIDVSVYYAGVDSFEVTVHTANGDFYYTDNNFYLMVYDFVEYVKKDAKYVDLCLWGFINHV